MGGLRKYMPSTFATFVIASLALAGIPPLAGFWSKDEILAGALQGQARAYPVMLVLGCMTAFMTAAYMTRAIWMTFFGEYRGEGTPHESPKVDDRPALDPGRRRRRGRVRQPARQAGPRRHRPALRALHRADLRLPGDRAPRVQLPAGRLLDPAGRRPASPWPGWYFARNRGPHGLTERSGLAAWGYRVLENKYYLDWLYESVIVEGIKGPIASGVYWFNQKVLDGVGQRGRDRRPRPRATGSTATSTREAWTGWSTPRGPAAEGSGQFLRRMQTGRVQQYAALLFAGAAVLAGIFIVII